MRTAICEGRRSSPGCIISFWFPMMKNPSIPLESGASGRRFGYGSEGHTSYGDS